RVHLQSPPYHSDKAQRHRQKSLRREKRPRLQSQLQRAGCGRTVSPRLAIGCAVASPSLETATVCSAVLSWPHSLVTSTRAEAYSRIDARINEIRCQIGHPPHKC